MEAKRTSGNHPASDIFPLLEGEEFQKLVDDIGEHGLLEAIVLDDDGRIVDGRNREAACFKAGKKPQYKPLPHGVSAVEYVVSENLRRRHMSQSQLACCAVEVLPMLEAEKEKNRLANLKRGDKMPDPTILSDRDRNGEATEYITQFADVKRNRKDVYDQFRLRYDDFISDEEVQTRLNGRKVLKLPADKKIVKALKTSLRVVQDAVKEKATVHNTRELFDLVSEIRGTLVQLRKHKVS